MKYSCSVSLFSIEILWYVIILLRNSSINRSHIAGSNNNIFCKYDAVKPYTESIQILFCTNRCSVLAVVRIYLRGMLKSTVFLSNV